MKKLLTGSGDVPKPMMVPSASQPVTLPPAVPVSAAAAAPGKEVSEPAPVPPPALPQTTLERWMPLFYIALTTGAEVGFIECYCHWHGAQFLLPNPLNLYSAANITRLTQIGFVGGPSVMSLTAEILMWSSLGVWSKRISDMADRYRAHPPDLPYDLAVYIGLLGCRTSIAAAVMIVLKLSGFKIFNMSLDNFEVAVGLAFILGYFGEHTERLLSRIREQVFGKKDLLRHPDKKK